MFAFSWSFLWPWVLLRVSQIWFNLLFAVFIQLEEVDGISPLSTIVDSPLLHFRSTGGWGLATCKQRIVRVLPWSEETLIFFFPEKPKLIWHTPENKPATLYGTGITSNDSLEATEIVFTCTFTSQLIRAPLWSTVLY